MPLSLLDRQPVRHVCSARRSGIARLPLGVMPLQPPWARRRPGRDTSHVTMTNAQRCPGARAGAPCDREPRRSDHRAASRAEHQPRTAPKPAVRARHRDRHRRVRHHLRLRGGDDSGDRGDRGRRPVGRSARPEAARHADLRSADGRPRSNRQGGADPFPASPTSGRDVRRGSPTGPRRGHHRRGPDVLDERRFRRTAILSAIAEGASGGDQRGASTITQQLVRARLLPEGATGPSAECYIRKAKELIQAIHVTEAFPGQAGKQQIITAYLNEIFYGHGAYGIAAAAQAYFGVTDLAKLTPAQAALLAGLPKSPTTLDPYNFAKTGRQGPPRGAARLAACGAARLDPQRARDRGRPMDAALAGPAAGRTRRADHPRRRQTAAQQGRPVHVAGPSRARRDPR